MSKVNVLLFAPYYPPAQRAGGPVRTLSALIRTAPRDYNVTVITRDRDIGGSAPLEVPRDVWVPGPGGRVRVRYVNMRRPVKVWRAYWSTRQSADIVYVNSFFEPFTAILPVALHRLGLWRRSVLLLAPRGEFSPGAWAISSRRKTAYRQLFRLFASDDMYWHASAPREENEIRAKMGSGVRVLIREDETDLPGDPLRAQSRPPNQSQRLRIAFVSRISPKKGLLILLKALRELRGEVALDVYGPEESLPEAREARRLAQLLPSNVSCTFHGVAQPDAVRQIFAEHDLFAFPTAGENFGHVIPEALSAGCPVMLPDTTPWTDAIRSGGGVVVPSRDPDMWARALARYAVGGPASWDSARADAAAAYERWITGAKGPHIFDLLTERMGRDEAEPVKSAGSLPR